MADYSESLIKSLIEKVKEYPRFSKEEIEKFCWMAVHEFKHGVVPSGQVAVVTTLGKVSGPSRRAGLNFKLPFVQSVYPFDIKTQVQPEKFETLTKDLQVIRATATVKLSLIHISEPTRPY